MISDMQQVVSQTGRRALSLVQNYYKTFDNAQARVGSWPEFYHPEAVLDWNGHEVRKDGLAHFAAHIPSTNMSFQCVDSHPIGPDAFVVTVEGRVSYNNGASKYRFFQRITASKAADGKTYITSDYFRWVAVD
jgi:hypothetical protein